jgi:3-keto-5-aminohexanoate cleavage enzyme
LIHAEREDLSLLAAAIGMGASFVRVGFEDSPRCSLQRIAQSNVELVECTAGMIRSLGLEVASPAEAREILGLLPDQAAALN